MDAEYNNQHHNKLRVGEKIVLSRAHLFICSDSRYTGTPIIKQKTKNSRYTTIPAPMKPNSVVGCAKCVVVNQKAITIAGKDIATLVAVLSGAILEY
jgi:hypothetical protein